MEVAQVQYQHLSNVPKMDKDVSLNVSQFSVIIIITYYTNIQVLQILNITAIFLSLRTNIHTFNTARTDIMITGHGAGGKMVINTSILSSSSPSPSLSNRMNYVNVLISL